MLCEYIDMFYNHFLWVNYLASAIYSEIMLCCESDLITLRDLITLT